MQFDVVIDDSLRHEGDNSLLVWKHPVEDFDLPTQLVVHESQEAVLLVNGIIKEVFGAGKHKIDLSKRISTENEDEEIKQDSSPDHCDLYFVNLVDQMAIRWGTSSRVQYIEPNYNFPIAIGASGEMTLSVADSRTLIQKMVGTENTLEKNQLSESFTALIMTRVKVYLTQVIKDESISIFEIDERLEDISSAIEKLLKKDFLEYGLLLRHFYVATIKKPESDGIYQRFRDLHFRRYADIEDAKIRQEVGIIDQQTESQKMEIEAHALAKKREIEGYSYQEEHNVGAKESGGCSSVFVNKFCDKCGQKLTPDAAFCHNCGASQKNNVKCKECGFVFIREGLYCPNCGSKR